MEHSLAIRPLNGALWPLLLKAGLTILQPRKVFGNADRAFCHQSPAPSMAQLRAYQKFFRFPAAGVPLCFYYPLLQKAQLASMLACKGLKVAGLIHLHNELQRLQTLTDTEFCQGGPLQIRTCLRTVEHSKGLLLRAEQQLWQHQQLVLTGSSEYLLEKAPRQKPELDRNKAVIQPQQHICDIHTATDASLGYAKLSGDYNPIHLWRWSALLFGQPQPILHGMASAALLCQALAEPVQQLSLQFKTAVVPGVPLQLTRQSVGEYALWQQQRLCLLAQVAPAQSQSHGPDAA